MMAEPQCRSAGIPFLLFFAITWCNISLLPCTLACLLHTLFTALSLHIDSRS
jgi:hypothetical protein